MIKSIDVKKAAKDFKKLLEEINYSTNQYVVKDNGKELAVLLSLHDFNNFQRLAKSKAEAKKRFFKIVDSIREKNKDMSFEQMEKDVVQAVSEVRKMNQEEKNR